MLARAHTNRVMCFHHFFVRSSTVISKVKEYGMLINRTASANFLLNHSPHPVSFYSTYCTFSFSTHTSTATAYGTAYNNNLWWNNPHCHYYYHTQQNGLKTINKNGYYIQTQSLHTSRVDNMKFVQFLRTSNGTQTRGLGVELSLSDEIVDLSAVDPTIPTDMKTFLEGSRTHLVNALRAVESDTHRIKKEDVKLLAPITQPDKLICIGMNYQDHCAEQNVKVPVEPVVFSKFSSCIIGPHDDIPYPEETEELDWEVELAFVIGKEGKKIAAKDAMSHVFGYTVAHDVSARDWQMKKNGRQWLLGKTMDGFCPLGPCIVMKENIMNPENLGIRCSVNGIIKQESNTCNLVHGIEKLVVYLSRFFTLKPGDVVITGTPPGVGVFRKPPEFLKKGDVVTCEIDEIGSITNKII